MHFITALPAGLEWVLALLVAIGALWVIGRKVVRWFRTMKQRLTTLYDSLAGFDELIDPATGQIVRTAIPGINTRVLTIEVWQAEMMPMMERLTIAVEHLATLDDRIAALEAKVQ